MARAKSRSWTQALDRFSASLKPSPAGRSPLAKYRRRQACRPARPVGRGCGRRRSESESLLGWTSVRPTAGSAGQAAGGCGQRRGRTGCAANRCRPGSAARSEEHTSELQSLMRHSYAVFRLKKKKSITQPHSEPTRTRPNSNPRAKHPSPTEQHSHTITPPLCNKLHCYNYLNTGTFMSVTTTVITTSKHDQHSARPPQ